MVKTFISMIVVALMIFSFSIFEQHYVNSSFDEFHQVLCVLYDKVDAQTATQEDVYAVQNNWLEKKQSLHAFIPHNDIKEIDLWLSESATLVRDEKWEDAISKIEVLKELSEQIPKTFTLSFENIF
ncbi:MAG: DUF4363 family protein [Clostridiales bacterium]|nr:DUF4363 family protein [Clostridiales bacterium]